ncbi:hypothetical protein CONPUDRAFT_154359 [Coniophora puteana RWD-64-598 SS2]|uniref:Uncharacterized protein n=1 Tax=Coniophora puteana (strain RWD-64-598) TaxID=741705 RepID=A0A5M3MNG9_CONPW|nr:uncharacterized protein CONPUDRAFT_154359 [Coniophora puteana RWD-64-598 SS2]EIW80324.1 hypothetical protein CONPUDRAFT_154359 [Coniophora puteana RWD-64-598 SS2]
MSPSCPAIDMSLVPLAVPSIISNTHKSTPSIMGRARGFSAPGSFTPLSQGRAAGCGFLYPRFTIPPITVPSDPPVSHRHEKYNQNPSHNLHPISPAVESPSTQFSAMGPSSGYGRSAHSNEATILGCLFTTTTLPSVVSGQPPNNRIFWSTSN